MSDPSYPDALPAQYRLHWYVLERVLGQGGFGITYLARDTNLDQTVAIKEYLPVDVATRRPDASVRSRTEDLGERYRWGLERFIREARTLAKFDHPSIVRVHSVFEINNTAYMVMRFEEGENLAALLERRRTLPEADLLRIVLPILDGLELVHDAGFIHRDIKPDNVYIRDDGSPVLLDFGSARHSLGHARTVTILVAPGYAPFEQYYSSGENQGPWTDLYSLGATCYRAIAGIEPMDAIARSKGILGSTREILVPAAMIGSGRYSPSVLAAVDHALQFAEKDRPQSIAEWRQELTSGGAQVKRGTAPEVVAPARPAAAPAASLRAPILWATLGAAVAVVLMLLWLLPPGTAPADNPAPPKPADLANREAKDAALLEQKRLAEAQAAAREAERRRLEEVEKAREVELRRLAEVEKARGAERLKREALETKLAALEARVKEEADARRKVEATRLRDAERARLEAELRNQAEAERKRQEQTRLAEEARRAESARKAEQARAAEEARKAEQERRAEEARVAAASKSSAPKPDLLALAEQANARGDRARYLDLMRQAADQGDARAQFSLGELYAGGEGVPQNNIQAYVWFSRAARGGSTRASARIEQLKTTMQAGDIRLADKLALAAPQPKPATPPDSDLLDEATKAAARGDDGRRVALLRQAAEQGNVQAMLEMGKIHAAGTGVAKSNFQAYVWYGRAARAGSAEGRSRAEQVKASLQPAEIRQAEPLLR